MKYQHYCLEWDGLEINETMVEFVACLCFCKSEEIDKIKDALEKNNGQ